MPFSISIGLSVLIHASVILFCYITKPLHLKAMKKHSFPRLKIYLGALTSFVIAFIIVTGAWEVINLSVKDDHSTINLISKIELLNQNSKHLDGKIAKLNNN
jgi:hypothetical protein